MDRERADGRMNKRRLSEWVLAYLASVCGAACYSVAAPAAPVTYGKPLCSRDTPQSACLPVRLVEHWLSHPELALVGASEAPRGSQGTKLLTLRLPSDQRGVVFRAKWRAISSTDKLNVPRKELAAYVAQTLFLDPEEYVVPPTSGHCLDLQQYRRHIQADANPTFARTACVFGFLQYWLETAKPLDEADDFDPHNGPLDKSHFNRDASYRSTLGNLNLLTFLIDHDDSHVNQFMLTGSGRQLRIYSVDNSMSFGTDTNPNLSPVEDWSRIQVPALPHEKLARLRGVARKDLESLATLQEYTLEQNKLVPTAKTQEARDRTGTLRWVNSNLQVGLSLGERDQLWYRRSALLQRVQLGTIPQY